ncbi:MAG: dihydrodipicolinate synthase family protein [Sphaerochaeta sp.]
MDKMRLDRIGGVIPAALTCFDEHENFDEQCQRSVVQFLLSKHVDGLYLTGSTGETFLMDGEERKKVVEVVCDEVAGRVPIIVHVGDIGTRKSIKLAEHAYEHGVSAISSVPPFYWKFSFDEVYRYYQELSSSVPLPMIVYNVALAGVVDFSQIKRLSTLDNVEGIKYTASTHHEILRIKEEIGQDFKVYSGSDEMALSGLAYGSDGLIGSFYNVIPELFIGLYKAHERGDWELAKLLQKQADAIIFCVLQYPMHASMKCMLSWIGIDAGTVRRPFSSLDAEKEKQLKEELRNLRDSYKIEGVAVLDVL